MIRQSIHSPSRLSCVRLLVASFIFSQSGLALGLSQEDADAAFANEQWMEAATQYSLLLDEYPEDGNNWFQLARARENLGDRKGAYEAYSQALVANYQWPIRVQYAMARMLAQLDDLDGALDLLEEIARSGTGPSFRTVQAAPEFEPFAEETRFQAVIEALKPCNSEEHHQFDFWLGQWDVTPAGSTVPTAFNSISTSQDGCVIVEEYIAGNFTGISLNFYDSVSRRWHQTWISNAGGSVYQEGGIRDDGSMEMTDRELPISKISGTVNKTVWTPLPDGNVQQIWSSSDDGGESWSIVFDGIYRPRPKQSP